MYPIKISKRYGVSTAILLTIEVCIALCVNDRFVRPFLGDTLAVIFVYCLIKTFCKLSYQKAAIIALLIAYSMELLQAIHFLETIGWAKNKLAIILLGNSFDWGDIIAYSVGFIIIVSVEQYLTQTK